MFYAANNKLSVKHCSTRYPIRLICSSDSQNVHHIYAIINTVCNVCLQFGSWRNTINCLKCAQYWETMEIQFIATMVLIHLNNKNNDLFYVKNQQSAPAKTYMECPRLSYKISASPSCPQPTNRWVVPELPVVELDKSNNNL